MQKRAHVLMIQSLGYLFEPGGEGSKNRIAAGQEKVRRGKIPRDAFMVWPQGYQKNNPTVRTRPESLGENLANYCRKQPEFAGMHIIQKPLTWGTKNDIMCAYEMMKERGYAMAHFYFVSDPAHLNRIKMVWALTRPTGWTAEFIATNAHQLSKFERWVREPVALSWYLFTLLPVTIKRTFKGRH